MKKIAPLVLTGIALLFASCSNTLVDSPVKEERYSDPVRAINMSAVDAYEQDDTQATAKTIASDGSIQEHNFYDDATDWFKFSATAGAVYTIESFILGSTDTILYVFDGTTQKATNDDKTSSDYGSKITFTAPSTKTYTIKAYSYNGTKGASKGYNISVTKAGSGGGTGTGVTLPQAQKKWTVLVYLDGDNNLSSYSTKDVQEMQTVGSNADFNIVLVWDNTSTTHGYYYVQSGSSTLLRDIGEPNMGSTATAKTFIDFAKTNFPADKYMWVYWNHGGAVDRSKGVAWDDTNGGDHLSEVEQKEIMDYGVSAFGKPFEVVGFDACLMATAEIFYQYRNVAKFMAASEQTEPGDGWDWKFLSTIKNNPSTTGDVVTKAILDTYATWYSSSVDVTFSAANLAYASQLGTAIDAFSQAAIASGITASTYSSLASNLPNFSGYTKDLVAYMNAINASSAVPQTVKDKALAVKNLIVNNLIIKNWTGSTWTNKGFGCAMTLLSDTTVYSQLDLCVDTKWDEFLTFAGFANAY